MSACSQSQITTGSWKIHNSYLDRGRLTGSDQTIFYQGEFGLFYFSTSDRESYPLTKTDGLYGNGFSTSAFDERNKKLVLAYPDGTLDIIGERSVRSLGTLRDNAEIQSKTINSIKVLSNATYIAADFGVAIVNTQNSQFVDAFQNIGPLGSRLKISDITEDEDAFYIASEIGVLKGLKMANLKDFRNWEFLGPTEGINVQQLEYFGQALLLLTTSGQLYTLDEQGLQELFSLGSVQFIKKLGDLLFFKYGRSVFQVHQNGSFEEVFSYGEDFEDFHLAHGMYYVFQQGKGLLDTNMSGSYAPNGPSTKAQAFVTSRENTYALPVYRPIQGGLNASERRQSSQLEAGSWSMFPDFEGVIAIHSLLDKTYIATRSTGVWLLENGQAERLVFPGVSDATNIRLMEVDHLGQVWIGLEDIQPRLIKITTDHQVTPVPISNMGFPHKILTDRLGNLYILQSNNIGVTSLSVFNEARGINRIITSQVNMGGLPNTNLQDIALDSEFRLWIASNNGLAYIPNVHVIQNNTAINAIQPLFNNLPLLNGESVTAVVTSPDRSLWIGTASNGLFHFNEIGSEMLAHFTRFNSPLLQNRISNLSYQREAGELFIVNPNGALSYKTGIIDPRVELETLKVYPNPVYPDFNGFLTAEGLTDSTEIRITTTSGRVVYGQQVTGGSFIWNIRDASGKRPISGVYLIFALDENGVERAMGKVVIL
ncbi:type IX secretion system anionic LPS delivery protein PorZ [Belliella filtrata]